MDKDEVIETVRKYAVKVRDALHPSAVVLYGSHASNSARMDSDIDVAVIFDGFSGDWLETSALLWRLRRDISDDIEPVLLDSTKDDSGFLQEIMKTGTLC
jgi:predicted nucleotidyltransferase